MAEWNRPKIAIYTDGGCEPNPGFGGWGAILVDHKGYERVLSGGERLTTNNRMEMMGAIAALESLEVPCQVEIVTDSRYLMDGATAWIFAWKKRSWMRKVKKKLEPVKNRDLWERLDVQISRHAVTWKWVRGHTGHPFNERCDALAAAEVARHRRAA